MVFDRALSAYARLPGPARFALNWFLRAAFASFLLAFWVNVASYWYAVRYGARAPVEGVPYLALVVGVLGFVLVILTLFTIYGLPIAIRTLGLVGRIIRSIVPMSGRRENSDKSAESQKRHKRWIKPTFWEFLNILIGSLGILIAVYGTGIFSFSFDRLFDATALNFFFYLLILLAVVGALLLISMIPERWLSWFSGFIYVIGLAIILSLSLWLPFDHVLRTTKFGGGIPISIEFENGDKTSNSYLFFTTRNVLTTYNPQENLFQELSRDNIARIEYRNKLVYHMPATRSISQIIGIDFRNLSRDNEHIIYEQ